MPDQSNALPPSTVDHDAAGSRGQGVGAAVLTCATWNIHRACGADGRFDPDRVLRVIADDARLGGADVLVLQEAEAERRPFAGFPALASLSSRTGLHSVHTVPDRRWGPASQGFLGTLVFLRPPLVAEQVTLVDLPGFYPRGAVLVEVQGAARPFHLLAAHLSLSQPLRVVQMRTLAQLLNRRAALPLVLVGDLNEWRPWGGLALSARVAGRRLLGPVRATFPARAAILPLDRILSDRDGWVRDVLAIRTAAVRAASDHLPLTARLVLS